MFFIASNVLTHYKQTLVAYITQLTYLICVATYKYYTADNMLKMLKASQYICHACMHLPYLTAGVVDTV